MLCRRGELGHDRWNGHKKIGSDCTGYERKRRHGKHPVLVVQAVKSDCDQRKARNNCRHGGAVNPHIQTKYENRVQNGCSRAGAQRHKHRLFRIANGAQQTGHTHAHADYRQRGQHNLHELKGQLCRITACAHKAHKLFQKRIGDRNSRGHDHRCVENGRGGQLARPRPFPAPMACEVIAVAAIDRPMLTDVVKNIRVAA